MPEYLAGDGTVLGMYDLFDAFDTDLGLHAFMWSAGDGLHDLGLLVDGGLAANGWERLYEASLMNGQGDIVGRGYRTSFPAPRSRSSCLRCQSHRRGFSCWALWLHLRSGLAVCGRFAGVAGKHSRPRET